MYEYISTIKKTKHLNEVNTVVRIPLNGVKRKKHMTGIREYFP